MLKRAAEMEREVRERMRGGTGSVEILHVLRPAELKGKTRLFARLTLQPGSSIGWHVHEGEEEIFYILSGEATVTDGDAVSAAGPGDAIVTGGGSGHAIEFTGSRPLQLMAAILLY